MQAVTFIHDAQCGEQAETVFCQSGREIGFHTCTQVQNTVRDCVYVNSIQSERLSAEKLPEPEDKER